MATVLALAIAGNAESARPANAQQLGGFLFGLLPKLVGLHHQSMRLGGGSGVVAYPIASTVAYTLAVLLVLQVGRAQVRSDDRLAAEGVRGARADRAGFAHGGGRGLRSRPVGPLLGLDVQERGGATREGPLQRAAFPARGQEQQSRRPPARGFQPVVPPRRVDDRPPPASPANGDGDPMTSVRLQPATASPWVH